MTFPVLLGTGRRLFVENPGKSTWHLSESITVGEGVLITILRRLRCGSRSLAAGGRAAS
jgi:hypothetical protein